MDAQEPGCEEGQGVTRYEYLVVTVLWGGDHAVIREALNARGAAGWRAIDLHWGQQDVLTVTFERALP